VRAARLRPLVCVSAFAMHHTCSFSTTRQTRFAVSPRSSIRMAAIGPRYFGRHTHRCHLRLIRWSLAGFLSHHRIRGSGSLGPSSSSFCLTLRGISCMARLAPTTSGCIAHWHDMDSIRTALLIAGTRRLRSSFICSARPMNPTETPNNTLQRTAASRCCSNRRVLWPPSLSLGR
jgi:hypothetical protein